MDLYGSELAVKINIRNTCSPDKFFKLCKKIVSRNCPEIGKIDFRIFEFLLDGI